MNKVENIKPGTIFYILGVKYLMMRDTGNTVDQPNINQWGRRTGGTHKARRVVVQTFRHHRGWSKPHYLAVADHHRIVVDPDSVFI